MIRTVILFERRRGRAFFKVSSNISGEKIKSRQRVRRVERTEEWCTAVDLGFHDVAFGALDEAYNGVLLRGRNLKVVQGRIEV